MSDEFRGDTRAESVPVDPLKSIKRRQYSRPRLRSYGSVVELTASGSKQGSESGMMNKP